MTDERLKYLVGYDDYFFYVESSRIASDVEYIQKNNVENIVLNSRADYQLRDVDWFSEVGNSLQRIVITAPSKGNFSFEGLSFCTNLLDLKINNYSNDIIDLRSNSRLKVLDIMHYKKGEGVECITEHESMIVCDAPNPDDPNKKFWPRESPSVIRMGVTKLRWLLRVSRRP